MNIYHDLSPFRCYITITDIFLINVCNIQLEAMLTAQYSVKQNVVKILLLYYC